MKKIILAAALLAACLAAAWCLADPMDRSAWLYRAQKAAFAQAAKAALAGEPFQTIPGVDALNVWPAAEDGTVLAVEFAIGAWGIGSQTDYWGVYTTTDGGPAGFQGANMPLTEADGVWTWREDGGDNTYETREIAQGWYCYKVHF